MNMRKLNKIKILITTVTLLYSIVSAAESIDRLDIGDIVYLQGVTSDEKVVVKKLDVDFNEVKIKRQNGTMEWVSPGRIIGIQKSIENDFKRGIGVFVATYAAMCALSGDCGTDSSN